MSNPSALTQLTEIHWNQLIGQIKELSYFNGNPSELRGWSDKYLASKRKTKILEKWQFISQHNLLLARYT